MADPVLKCPRRPSNGLIALSVLPLLIGAVVLFYPVAARGHDAFAWLSDVHLVVLGIAVILFAVLQVAADIFLLAPPVRFFAAGLLCGGYACMAIGTSLDMFRISSLESGGLAVIEFLLCIRRI